VKQPKRSGGPALPNWLPWILLAAAVALFVWHSSSSAFLQDDSFITYRYARNVVRGLGPVFNPGERTEGYTNFLWMMLLALLGVAGLPFSAIIPLSQVIGVLCGVGIITIFFFLVRRHTRGPPALAGFAVLLLSSNGAFAYWCVSGMETALFTLFLAAAFWFYARDSSPRSLLTASSLLGLSALARPEGALFMAVFGLHYFLRAMFPKRGFFTALHLRRFALFVLPFAALVLPLYVWRLSYYGYLFPNTYYAKTGASLAYLKAGIDYLVNFHKAYGIWGVGFIVPVVFLAVRRRLRLSEPFSLALLAVLVHTLYIVWVGGDVLRIYRFFVPVLFLFYLLVSEGIWQLPLPRTLNFLILVGLLPLTFIGPLTTPRTVHADILRNLQLEGGLVKKMSATGRWFNRHLGDDDWFGCTTIGAVSWHADRNMVDMLGLTDANIAHNPENILEAEWHWKERNYNTAYVLGLKPRYLYFSTGIKPSAEAERALFLRPQFRRGYYACPVTVVDTASGRTAQFVETVYRRRPDADSIPLEPVAQPTTFINRYLDGINFLRVGTDTAIRLFRRCIEQAPPDFGYPFEWLGQVYQSQRRTDLAVEHYQEAVRRNDRCITSHISLAGIYADRKQTDSAVVHLRKVVSYAPEYHEGYANLSALLGQAGDHAAAETVLVAAAEQLPEIPDFLLRLGLTRYRLGRLSLAESDIDRYLTLRPDDRNALGLRDEIRRLRARPAGPVPALPPGP
jgi:arabinofuranosyltransferase